MRSRIARGMLFCNPVKRIHIKDAVLSSVDAISPRDFLPRFGLSAFRPGQDDVVNAILAGNDCLCIMPTGGGKSLCYQLPSVMREGMTLVVSPLIALMKDQVDSLKRLGIRASFVNSTLTVSDQIDRLERMGKGELDLMYVAPERFRSQRFVDAVRQTKVQLLAVDEAHCISEWGHDFRHDYTRLGTFRQRLGDPQTIALTATATADVREDVVKQLRLHSPEVFVAGFSRPNLHYAVQPYSAKKDKIDAIIEFLQHHTEGSGIIYASTRKGCEEVAEAIGPAAKRRIVVYHGGMLPDDRRSVQEAFMSDQADIVVATNAFGMGIDKPDVRFVLHYNLPGSLEAYYQEAGRAGRDGLDSKCLMLYSPSDRFIQEFFIDSAHPPPETIHAIYDFLRRHPDDPIELTQEELKEELGLSIGADGVGTCERLLEKAGVLERLEPNRNMAAIRFDTEVDNVVDLLPKQASSKRAVARELEKLVGSRRNEFVYFRPGDIGLRLEMQPAALARNLRELNKSESFVYVPPFRGRAVRMIRKDLSFDELNVDFTDLEARRKANLEKLDRVVRFSTTARCRQQTILEYFGEEAAEECGHCDNCDASMTKPEHHACEASAGLLEVVVMTLSGVARAKGRFGKNVVAQMLCGSNSAKMKKWNLDRLSTFGLLEFLKQSEVNQLLDSLLQVGLIEQSQVNRFRPVVSITPAGNQVMRRQMAMPKIALPPDLQRKLDRRRPSRQPVATQAPSATPDRSIPSLKEQAESVPREEAGFSTLQEDSPAENLSREEIQQQVIQNAPESYWTWRLVNEGFSIGECAAVRRLDREVIVDQLMRAIEEGHVVQPESVFSSSQLRELENAVDQANSTEIRSILSILPKTFSFQSVLLYLKTTGQFDTTSG